MLTERQRAIYEFILRFRKENGCSPSIPEIQREFGIRSPNGVAGHLKALQAKGWIQRAGGRGSRRVDVVGQRMPASLHELPVYGQIRAGYPDYISAAPAEGFLRMDETGLGFTPKAGTFALRVRGDSMRDAAILEGDTVIVEPTPNPSAGQIVVALIDGESTLKRLVRIKGRWFLKAENPAYPTLYPRSELVIQGVVRTLIRRFE